MCIAHSLPRNVASQREQLIFSKYWCLRPTCVSATRFVFHLITLDEFNVPSLIGVTTNWPDNLAEKLKRIEMWVTIPLNSFKIVAFVCRLSRLCVGSSEILYRIVSAAEFAISFFFSCQFRENCTIRHLWLRAVGIG